MDQFARYNFVARAVKVAQTKLYDFTDTEPNNAFAAANADKDNPFDFRQAQGTNQNFFGSQVISNLEIEPFKYEELNGTPVSVLKGLKVDAVIMTVTQTKNIITTPVQGRNGTVKEYISDGDYSIDIEGILASKDNEYPTEEVKALIRILKAPVPIKMTSKFLSYLGITDVVITNYNLPQQRGFENTQPFNITGISDVPLELQTNSI